MSVLVTYAALKTKHENKITILKKIVAWNNNVLLLRMLWVSWIGLAWVTCMAAINWELTWGGGVA